jgi:hypothetical protein
LAQRPWYLFAKHAIVGATRIDRARYDMAGPTIAELDRRIALIRQNINDLVEQAAAYSGAGDESRAADRIARQEQELRRLIEQRDALAKKQ